jgi:hypothetical protein
MGCEWNSQVAANEQAKRGIRRPADVDSTPAYAEVPVSRLRQKNTSWRN